MSNFPAVRIYPVRAVNPNGVQSIPDAEWWPVTGAPPPAAPPVQQHAPAPQQAVAPQHHYGYSPNPNLYAGHKAPLAKPLAQGAALGCILPIIFCTVGFGLFVLIMLGMIFTAGVAKNHVVPGFLGVMNVSGTPESRAADAQRARQQQMQPTRPTQPQRTHK